MQPIQISQLKLDCPARYRVRVRGSVHPRWQEWFDGLRIQNETGDGDEMLCTLTGTVQDQAALLGILQRLCHLGLPLIDVTWLAEEPA
jgi:hypothetical protein